MSEITEFLLMETQKNIWVSAVVQLLLVAIFQQNVKAESYTQICDSAAADGSLHEYAAKTLNEGLKVSFSQYAGKYVLVVNVATF